MLHRRKPRARLSATALFILGASLTLSTFSATPAEARHHRHAGQRVARSHGVAATRHTASHVRQSGTTANFAAIVVDANTGRTLYGRNENELRHPASITKVMTLFLLFEQLEKGRLHLDSEIPVSAHAAAQSPTKLGLRPGSTITVENAIKAVVTRSANDMAVAIAEAVGGDEENFAALMTRKAHALGMTRTEYHNASGLPHAEQWTSARDLSILGRAIQERFPRYYAFFSTHVFYFRGQAIANHNHLLDRVEGMDGIKTGYTNASGFNILTSVKRRGHFLVSVVMGGQSAAGRDRIMAGLIDQYIADTGTTRTASNVGENGAAEADDDDETSATRKAVKPVDDEKPAPKAIAASAPVQVASIGNIVPVERVRPAFVSVAPRTATAEDRSIATATLPPRRTSVDGSTADSAARGGASSTPSGMRWVVGARPAREHAPEVPVKLTKLEPPARVEPRSEHAKSEPPKSEAAKAEAARGTESTRPAGLRGGWMIQIGATDDAAKAGALLARAKTQSHNMLGSATPFTEKVQKGAGTLYRARFAGLEENTAETVCRSLKRSGFACFATKN